MLLRRASISVIWAVAAILIIPNIHGCCRRNQPKTGCKSNDPKEQLTCYATKVAADFGTFDNIMRWYNLTAKVHRNIVRLIEIGRSVENRPLNVIRLSSRRRDDRPIIFIEAGIHAREWLSPATLNYFINRLTTEYKSGSRRTRKLLNSYVFYLESVANPDGYVYSFKNKSTRLWRKNRRRIPSSRCMGVDLNRNWNIGFGEGRSSRDPCSITYIGQSAFSEPETNAIKNFLLNRIGIGNLTLYISVHSFSQLLLVPYSYTNVKPQRYTELVRVANISRDAIAATCSSSDCIYYVENGAEIFGVTKGGSDDWVLHTMRANYSYTIELRPSILNVTTNDGFIVSKNLIPTSGHEFFVGVTAMLEAISKT